MARPRNTQERRAQIVTALLTVMAKQGYERASIVAVAAEAGLTPGLVHYHFKSKQEILLSLVVCLHEARRVELDARLARAGDPVARLLAFVDAHLDPAADPDRAAAACWVTIGAEALRQDEVRRLFEELTRGQAGELRLLLTDALRARGRTTADVEALAAGVLAAIQGCHHLAATTPGVVPAGSPARTVRRMVMGLIDSQSSAASGRPGRSTGGKAR
ncbi:MAG: TetR/AcrR family transcriptional regulator [Candidatus Riflebacteria bacterium]|nr:TetR/AcrR family transcriptional regulator [Candidatus Riflebacteria bacterium]